ncbi:MAG: TonB-dependent receptor [Rhodopila sp.]|nr:TonB-dependent receptor [Rhodopila sp.]
MFHSHRVYRRAAILLAGTSSLAIALAAQAQDATSIGKVTATGQGMTQQQIEQTAPYQAPTTQPLDATQPTSVFSQHFIENNLAQTGSYADVVKFAPSVWTTAENGPGLSEANVFMRGFVDGQYNVTFDGIPWGDSNDFTHHSNIYFMAHNIGSINVDRGPGTASTIGNATFGGTIGIESKEPSDSLSINPFSSFGSFGTRLFGIEADTGRIELTDGTRAFFTYQNNHSDGFLQYAGQDRANYFGKIEQPLGRDSVLTIVSTTGYTDQSYLNGATKSDMAKYGYNYTGLNGTPGTQGYYPYNKDWYNVDFSYIGLKSAALPYDIVVDSKIYTYGYYHLSNNGYGTSPATNTNGNALGLFKRNEYRSFGETLRLSRTFDNLEIRVGNWFDHQSNERTQNYIDVVTDQALVYSLSPAKVKSKSAPINGLAFTRQMNDSLDTLQPYVEAELKVTPAFSVTAGVKYNYFNRQETAPVQQSTLKPFDGGKTWTQAVPSLVARYEIEKNWSVYAQVAQGFLAPNLNTLYTTNQANAGSASPQTTWNYQAGTSFQSGRFALAADVYYIDFHNLINSATATDGSTFTYNAGGARYSGFEAEGTVYIGSGFSTYGNLSLNQAVDKATGQREPNAPDATAVGGVIYNKDGVYASLMEKWVGSRYGAQVAAACPAGQSFCGYNVAPGSGLDPFGVLNASVSVDLRRLEIPGMDKLPGAVLKLNANNLLDTHVINGLAAAGSTPAQNLWYVLPGRSVFATVELKF